MRPNRRAPQLVHAEPHGPVRRPRPHPAFRSGSQSDGDHTAFPQNASIEDPHRDDRQRKPTSAERRLARAHEPYRERPPRDVGTIIPSTASPRASALAGVITLPRTRSRRDGQVTIASAFPAPVARYSYGDISIVARASSRACEQGPGAATANMLCVGTSRIMHASVRALVSVIRRLPYVASRGAVLRSRGLHASENASRDAVRLQA